MKQIPETFTKAHETDCFYFFVFSTSSRVENALQNEQSWRKTKSKYGKPNHTHQRPNQYHHRPKATPKPDKYMEETISLGQPMEGVEYDHLEKFKVLLVNNNIMYFLIVIATPKKVTIFGIYNIFVYST